MVLGIGPARVHTLSHEHGVAEGVVVGRSAMRQSIIDNEGQGGHWRVVVREKSGKRLSSKRERERERERVRKKEEEK